MQLLAEISVVEWVAGVSSLIVSSLVVASFLTVAAHISNPDIHAKKRDIVFSNVCDEKEKGVAAEIENLKETITKLDGTVTAGFVAITAQIQNLRK